jgi:hypothetical protein
MKWKRFERKQSLLVLIVPFQYFPRGIKKIILKDSRPQCDNWNPEPPVEYETGMLTVNENMHLVRGLQF